MLTVIGGLGGGAVRMMENSDNLRHHLLPVYEQCDRYCHGRIASEGGCIFKSYQYVGPARILEQYQGILQAGRGVPWRVRLGS